MNNIPKAVILIVDDTPANLRLLSGMLTQQGYKARPTPRASAALKSAQLSPPDLILLDIQMPGIDGWSVLAALKTDEQLRQVPVVPMTIVDDKPKARGLGASDYLLKPVCSEDLGQVVRSYCSGTPNILVVDDDAEDRKSSQKF